MVGMERFLFGRVDFIQYFYETTQASRAVLGPGRSAISILPRVYQLFATYGVIISVKVR